MSKQKATEAEIKSLQFSLKKILVPIDGSANAIRAAEVGIRLASDYHSELTLLNVIPMPTQIAEATMGIGVPASVTEDYYEYAQKSGSRWVDEVATTAKSRGVSARAEITKTFSSVVETIVSTASGENVDLIVIGTRGIGGFKKLLLGSVSGGVITHAQCNVLVVR